MQPTKIHYHIRELERNELLEVVETRQIGGITEKFYLPVAVNIYVISENRDEVVKALAMEYLEAYLKLESTRDTLAFLNILHVTPKEKIQFESELHAFYGKWKEKCGSKSGPGGETRRFISLFYPH